MIRLYLCLISLFYWLPVQAIPLYEADEIAQKVFEVNLFYGVDNVRYGHLKKKKKSILIIHQTPKKKRKKFSFVRFLNNRVKEKGVRAKDLIIFYSGQMKGAALLASLRNDERNSLSILVWWPALRKVRPQTEPNLDEHWNGSLFTYGDIYLRRPQDEYHQLLPSAPLSSCLKVFEGLSDKDYRPYLKKAPQPRCDLKGKEMLRIKSTPKKANSSYDYRIQWIDPDTFADYRSDYYQNGKLRKRIDKSWYSMGLDDPQAQYWLYWYGEDYKTGDKVIAVIDRDHVAWNEKVNPRIWTEAYLHRLKR